MSVDWDRICDFVFDTFGDDNAEMARYTLIEFGVDPDTRRPFTEPPYTYDELDVITNPRRNASYSPRVHAYNCGCSACEGLRNS